MIDIQCKVSVVCNLPNMPDFVGEGLRYIGVNAYPSQSDEDPKIVTIHIGDQIIPVRASDLLRAVRHAADICQ